MIRRASLPMYDLPEVREATDAWWQGLARALRTAGVDGVPDELTRSADPAEDWRDPELLLSQTCGFPLVHEFSGRLLPVATPCHAAAACDGPLYRSRIVVGAASAATRLEDLRGKVCAVNGWDSQSGWNALAAAVAPSAEDGRFFGGAIVTGSHAASLAAVAAGEATVAAIDAVTFALLTRYRPEALDGTRVLAESDPAPGLPYVTRAAASPDEVGRLRRGIAAAFADPDLAGARDALMLAGVAFLGREGYAPIAAMAERAAGLVRPEIGARQ